MKSLVYQNKTTYITWNKESKMFHVWRKDSFIYATRIRAEADKFAKLHGNYDATWNRINN